MIGKEEKNMNETIKPLFVPFLCMAIMVPLTILVLGPLSTMFANGVANGYNYLVAVAPAVAAAMPAVLLARVRWEREEKRSLAR